MNTKLQEPVGWLYEWPNGRKEFRSSDKPKDFDAWAATITPLYSSPTLAHQPVTAGWNEAIQKCAEAVELYAASYAKMSKMGDGNVSASDVAYDLRNNIIARNFAALKSEGRK